MRRDQRTYEQLSVFKAESIWEIRRGVGVHLRALLLTILVVLGSCLGSVRVEAAAEANTSQLEGTLAALESNFSKIEDITLEYTATTINKGEEKPLFVTNYKWIMKGDKQRVEYDEGGAHHTEVFDGERFISVYERPGRPREISISKTTPIDVWDRGYVTASPSGFLFHDAGMSFVDILKRHVRGSEVDRNVATVEMAGYPHAAHVVSLSVDLEKGVPMRRKVLAYGRCTAEYVVTEPINQNGIWFMKKGVLHRYAHKRGKNGELYSENTQDVFVEITDMRFNAGLSDSLFAIVPEEGDIASEEIDGVLVDYFESAERKHGRVEKETARRNAIASLRGKPAPQLQIERWVNREPDVSGKPRVYLFWSQTCGPSTWLLKTMDRQYKVLSDYVEVVGIHRSANAQGMEDFLARNKISVPVGIDKQDATHREYFVDRWPSSYLIDKDGTFVADTRGCRFLGDSVTVPPELEERYREAAFAQE